MDKTLKMERNSDASLLELSHICSCGVMNMVLQLSSLLLSLHCRLRQHIMLVECFHLQTLCRVFLRHLLHLLCFLLHQLTFLYHPPLSESILPPLMIFRKCKEHQRRFQKEWSSYSWRCNASDEIHNTAHLTTELVSGALRLIVDKVTVSTILQTETSIETLHMIDTQLEKAIDLQDM